ncbi:MAG: hypothetical protein QNI84_06755 [Henriciella sp.]|nr:hypothetical protein [Henriciella sp.]
MKRLFISFAISGLAFSQAIAQEAMQETVVVTASMIDEDDLSETPNATLRVRADFVLYELSYINSTLDPSERKSEMKDMYEAVLREVSRQPGLTLLAGDAFAYANIETVTFDEIYANYGNQGRLDFVVRADVGSNETYQRVRSRVENYVKASGEVGRSQSILDEEQYLGVSDLKSYRSALIQTIWDDIYTSSNPNGATDVEILGLEARTQYRPVGPLELELFIPYIIEYETVIER